MCTHHIPFNSAAATRQDPHAHQEEHAYWSRRTFAKALGLSGVGGLLLSNTPIAASGASPLSALLSNVENERILVIIRLKGGNDGLNTVVPLNQYDTYASYRPSLRIKENETFKLNQSYAMPDFMKSLESVWGEGMMKVVHGVGYDNPSLSHFSGSTNWATASSQKGESETGWLGRYFEDLYPDFLFEPPAIPAAIQIGNNGNIIFEGEEANYAFAVANPNELYKVASNGTLFDIRNQPDCTYGDQSTYLRGVANNTFSYAGVINDAFTKAEEGTGYTNGKLSKQLSIVSRLIKGNLGTRVYMVTLGGFDTHGGQSNTHQELLTEVADSVRALYDDLSAAGRQNDVLTMTISEFGRRPRENGSAGTDHGTASPLFLFGGGLNASGFVGTAPSLKDLDRSGNMKFTQDFRQVYATVLSEWLCLDPDLVNRILLGQDYDQLPLGINCSRTLSQEIFETPVLQMDHFFWYKNGVPTIQYSLQNADNVSVRLYALTGQEVAVLQSERQDMGIHEAVITPDIYHQMSQGQYIYRISTSRGNFSKSFLLD